MAKKEKKTIEKQLLEEQKELVNEQFETENIEVDGKPKKKIIVSQWIAPFKMALKWMKSHRQLLQITLIILLFGVTAFSGLLFPRSGFARFVDNTLGQFFDVTAIFMDNYLRIIESAGIILFIWALNKILQMLIDGVFGRKVTNITAFLLVKKIIRFTLIFAAAFLILTAFGVNSTAIVASIGIVGLVVSFGAQKLVEDVISGLFLIVEKQFAVGDIVIISDYRGVIQEIGLRTTKVVDAANLDVKIFNNSDIRNIVNLTANVSTAFCEMSIEYSQNIPEVEEKINAFLPKIKEKYPEIIEGPNYLGVQDLADSAVILRYSAKTLEANKFKIQRALKRELKVFFDENGINIPFPQLVIHKGE